MSKVKINPKYPNNPGLLEGKYWLFVDNKLDFMDDTNMFPTKAQLRFKPSTIGLTNLETVYTKQRAARDAYLKDSNELFYKHLLNYRMTGDAYPKIFENRSIDLSIDESASSDNWPYTAAAEHLKTRFIFPSQVDGSNNWPARNIEGAEMCAWDNPSMPKKAVKILSKADNWSMESLINRYQFQSGGDLGDFNLPLSLAMSNPFLGATISWPVEENYYNGSNWVYGIHDKVWGSDWKQQFFSTAVDEYEMGYSVEDGTGIILNYQDMHTFYRAVKDDFLKMGNEIALARTTVIETHNIDGDDAKLNAAIAATGLTAKQAELSLAQEQLANLNLEYIALVNADQILIDAKQAQITAKQIELDVKQAELNLAQEQLDSLNYELSLLNDGEAEYQAALPEINEPSTPPLFTQVEVDRLIGLHTEYLAKQAEIDAKQAEIATIEKAKTEALLKIEMFNLELTAIINAEQILIDAKYAEIAAKESELSQLSSERDAFQAIKNVQGLELQQLISDGADQALIDAKTAELNASDLLVSERMNEIEKVQETLDKLNLELTALINDSADQAEIAAKQAEIDAKNEEVNLVTNELDNLTTEVSQLILFLTKQNGMMKAYSLMKAWILSNPLPNIDMAKCTINGVVSPVLKNSFVNSYTMQNLYNSGWISQAELSELQQNPVTPLEYFGEINLNYVPAVKYVAELKGVEGQMGDMIFVEEIGQKMAFDGENWTEAQHGIFEESGLLSAKAVQDAKFKAFNEISLAMKPFTWAAHHIPAYMITENNEIRTESDRTVFDFVSFHAGTTPQ